MTCKRVSITTNGTETTAFFGLVLDAKTFSDVLAWTERHGTDPYSGSFLQSEAFIRAAICEKLRSQI